MPRQPAAVVLREHSMLITVLPPTHFSLLCRYVLEPGAQPGEWDGVLPRSLTTPFTSFEKHANRTPSWPVFVSFISPLRVVRNPRWFTGEGNLNQPR